MSVARVHGRPVVVVAVTEVGTDSRWDVSTRDDIRVPHSTLIINYQGVTAW